MTDLMDYETFFWKYANQKNPKTGKLWSPSEIALDSTLSLQEVNDRVAFYQTYFGQCIQDGKPFVPDEMFAARYVSHPDDRPLASDEHWEIRPIPMPPGFIRIRMKNAAAPVTQPDPDTITLLRSIADKLDKLLSR